MHSSKTNSFLKKISFFNAKISNLNYPDYVLYTYLMGFILKILKAYK